MGNCTSGGYRDYAAEEAATAERYGSYGKGSDPRYNGPMYRSTSHTPSGRVSGSTSSRPSNWTTTQTRWR